MFRVVHYQAVLRILFVCVGLLVSGAAGQDQGAQKSTDKPANGATISASAQPVSAQTEATSSEQSSTAQTQPAPAKPAPEAVDPLTRPADAKQKKKNERALKQELSRR